MIFPKLYVRACVGLTGSLKCTENSHCMPLSLLLLFCMAVNDSSLFIRQAFSSARRLLLSNSSHSLLPPIVLQTLVLFIARVHERTNYRPN